MPYLFLINSQITVQRVRQYANQTKSGCLVLHVSELVKTITLGGAKPIREKKDADVKTVW